MKKSLVLAMAMAMGVTASAYAANPFADVPAGHWAYDAVAQLADAGVVDGYGATFGGDKLMTRYEMAQIVAKAMAKGGNCDKLAAEFADELDALGVRVAKLEKKVDNVKITGNIRYSYADNTDYDGKKRAGTKSYNRFRTRLFVGGEINKNWKYTGMLENDHMLRTPDKRDGDSIGLKRAFLNGRVGGVKVEAGRAFFSQADMIEERADGIKASYKFGKVNLTGWALKSFVGTTAYETGLDGDRIYMAKADTKFGKLGAFVQYWKVDGTDYTAKTDKAAEKWEANSGEIFEVGLSYPVAKGLTLFGQYYRGNNDDKYKKLDENGWEIGLKYLGASAAKPGSWGAWVTYDDRPVSTYIHPTNLNTYWAGSFGATQDGFKGFEIGANYTFAKNIVGEVRYFTYDAREGKGDTDTLWAHVVFTF